MISLLLMTCMRTRSRLRASRPRRRRFRRERERVRAHVLMHIIVIVHNLLHVVHCAGYYTQRLEDVLLIARPVNECPWIVLYCIHLANTVQFHAATGSLYCPPTGL